MGTFIVLIILNLAVVLFIIMKVIQIRGEEFSFDLEEEIRKELLDSQ